MKRKYYMRGLGIGVIITAILFTLAFPKNKPEMTEAEIIAKAKELGYVKKTEGVTPEDINKIKEQEGIGTTPEATPDSTVTPDTTPEPSGTPGPTASPVPTPDAPIPPEEPDKPEVPETPTKVPTKAPTQKVEPPEPTKAPTMEPTKQPTPTAGLTKAPTKQPTATAGPTKVPVTGAITVKIERGMTATKVARLLEAAGAVDSATEFASYLRKNNLADEINIGTFSVPAGASYEEIGKLLTEIR